MRPPEDVGRFNETNTGNSLAIVSSPVDQKREGVVGHTGVGVDTAAAPATPSWNGGNENPERVTLYVRVAQLSTIVHTRIHAEIAVFHKTDKPLLIMI